MPKPPAVIALIAAAFAAGTAISADLVRRNAPIKEVFMDDKRLVAEVWLDPDTQCLYLIRGDSIIPRLDRTGRPSCAATGR